MRLSWVVRLLSVGGGCSSSGGNGNPGAGGNGASGAGSSTGGSGAGGNGATSADSLDCAWLASENCWKTTATSASSCLPPATEHGVLNADNTSCTFASGAVVTFTQALVLPVPDSPTWNFTIANQGQTCLHYQETQTGFTLTVGSQTVKEASTGALGLQITCPGGASFSDSNAFDLLNCDSDAGLFGGLPGNAYSETTTGLIFGLIGTSTTSSNELQLFNCSK
jgi:hypothetical protein